MARMKKLVPLCAAEVTHIRKCATVLETSKERGAWGFFVAQGEIVKQYEAIHCSSFIHQ